MRTRWAGLAALVSIIAAAGEPVLEVGAGRQKVLAVPGLQRIAVDEAGVVDAKAMGRDQILLIGGDLGETTLHAFTKSGEQRFTIKVLNMSLQEEILKLVASSAAAWNRGDLKAFVSGYAPDAVFVTPSGVTKGRDQVLARYQKKYPDAKAMGQLTLEPVDVRADESAVSVAAKWTLSYPDKPAATGHTVIVFMQGKGGWRIVHDASM